MGFNKRYIPDLESLKKIRETMANDGRFLDIYLFKSDALIGSTESLKYLEELASIKEITNGI